MHFKDFALGTEFVTGSGKRWRVTDLGSRTVIAVCLDDHPDDPSWYTGPPYAVVEHVFDANAWLDCHLWPLRDDLA